MRGGMIIHEYVNIDPPRTDMRDTHEKWGEGLQKKKNAPAHAQRESEAYVH